MSDSSGRPANPPDRGAPLRPAPAGAFLDPDAPPPSTSLDGPTEVFVDTSLEALEEAAGVAAPASAMPASAAPASEMPASEMPASEMPSSAMPSSVAQTSSRVFGKYRLLAELGRGGMADVHLAVAAGPAGFSKLQVIKRLRPGIMDEAEMRLMMLDEARLAARLNHKNIVQTNEVGIVDDQYFLAMEYLDGQPYHRILKRATQLGRAIPLPFAVKILCEVLSGLHYAHEARDYDGEPLGVVHRDVSPQNLFVTYDGQVKVVDFGIAKSTGRLVETQTGIIRGKITYMAPEQAFAATVDRRADLFSVGVLLWEAIAGERMWGNLSDPEIVARMLHEIPRIKSVRPDAPADLAELCDHALAREPEKRPATAAEMRTVLEEYLALHDIQVTAEALGALVVDLFAEEREELHKMVDRELALLRAENDLLERSDLAPGLRRISDPSMRKKAGIIPGAGPIPTAPGRLSSPSAPPNARIPSAPPLSAALMQAGQRRTPPPPLATPIPAAKPTPFPDSSGGPTIPRAPAFAADDIMTAREMSPPVAVLSNHPAAPSSMGAPSAGPSWDPGAPSRPAWRRLALYAGAGFIALAAVFLFAKASFSPGGGAAGGLTSETTATAAPTLTAAASAAPIITAQPEGNYVHIRINVNPTGGRILVDGSYLPLQSGPFEGKFLKDGAVHRITAEASGFYPYSKMVVFDKDQTVDFILRTKKGGK